MGNCLQLDRLCEKYLQERHEMEGISYVTSMLCNKADYNGDTFVWITTATYTSPLSMFTVISLVSTLVVLDIIGRKHANAVAYVNV